jgi:hypothetical protein
MNIMNYPFVVVGLSFALLWLSALIGASFRRRRQLRDADREDFSLVIAATLTLLGLIIGFSFSMAVSRYDLRKNYEEAEANAIGTEYVRADLLPAADAERIRLLLRQYLDERVMFYRIRDSRELQHINVVTSQLQTDLWNSVKSPAEAKPTPVVALAVSGMNDVLNTQGYTQAAWWNRIPIAAWGLMVAIAICCNLLIGYGALHAEAKSVRLIVLPLVVSISFLLIADIDSPRSGIIHVSPQNLLSLVQSMNPN